MNRKMSGLAENLIKYSSIEVDRGVVCSLEIKRYDGD